MSRTRYKGLVTEPMPLFNEEKRKIFGNLIHLEVCEKIMEDYLAEVISDFDALLVVYARVTHKVIEKAANLKVIARYGIGTDNIDIKAATEHNIVVTYVPEYHLPTVAEHALVLMLSLARKIPQADRDVRAGNWEYRKFCGVDIEGKILGIVGLGRTGLTLAQKAQGLGLRVVGYDPYVNKKDVLKERQIGFVSFEELLRQSDFVSVHIPLSEETRNLFDTAQFGMMKCSAFFINTSRGAIVNETALYEALKNRQIMGAAVDVMSTEPPGSSNKLYELDNIIFTPHTAWFTKEAMLRLEMTAAQSVVDVLNGKKPKYVRNPEVYEKR